IYACIASLLATIAIVYTKANTVFGTAPIGLWHWIIAITISLSIVGIFDVIKMINIRRNKIIE
ncbi:MAG: cation transporting ATPase C-terminal domain-containing protein, partial [archaeon]